MSARPNVFSNERKLDAVSKKQPDSTRNDETNSIGDSYADTYNGSLVSNPTRTPDYVREREAHTSEDGMSTRPKRLAAQRAEEVWRHILPTRKPRIRAVYQHGTSIEGEHCTVYRKIILDSSLLQGEYISPRMNQNNSIPT